MAEYVLRAGMRVPDKPALEVLGGALWSHGEIRRAITGLAGGMLHAGYKPGQRVLLRLGNRVEFPISYLACIWSGLIPVPTSALLNATEITKIADQVSPDLIIADGETAVPDCNTPILSVDDLAKLQEAEPCPAQTGDPNRLAYIVFTSGTSGTPRGVCHAHRAIWARRMMFDGWYGLTAQDRILHAGAFNWSYTMGTGLMDPWSVGATALIPNTPMASDDLANAITTARPSIFAAAPGVYRQLLRSPELKSTQTLRHGLSAGEALAPSLRDRWTAHMGCDIHEALGMSECSTFISGSPKDPAPAGTSGRAQAGRQIKVDPSGNLMIGRDDPGLMLGYLNDGNPLPEWFQTGDTVSMDAEGWVTYLGRNDDLITSGGFRISPLEIEDAFASFHGLSECAATGVRVNGDTTLTALFYTAPSDLSEVELRDHAQSLLASYKQPHLYIARAALPKGANGKLNRKLLRDEFEANQ